jgi:hypothetical protein
MVFSRSFVAGQLGQTPFCLCIAYCSTASFHRHCEAKVAPLRPRVYFPSKGVWNHMAYERPENKLPLSPEEKPVLLKQYFEYYRGLYEKNPSALNAKLPRSAFDDLLNELGEMLLERSKSLASDEGLVRDFLNNNELPPAIPAIAERLSPEYRVFCLALNAIKQWVAAEQSATDRYLLGGTSRKLCRAATDSCLVSKDILGSDCELHHPVRDGRPAVPLSKRGHDMIEGQISSDGDDPIGHALSKLRREGNRSWAQLRRGCLDLIGQPEPGASKRGAANDRTFARNAVTATNLSYQEILERLDENGL